MSDVPGGSANALCGHAEVVVRAWARLVAPDGARRIDVDVVPPAESVHPIDEIDRNRHQFHDLLRSYAVEQAVAEDPDAVRATAMARDLVLWYLHCVANAAQVLPQRHYIRPTQTESGPRPLSFTTHEEALEWASNKQPRHRIARPQSPGRGHHRTRRGAAVAETRRGVARRGLHSAQPRLRPPGGSRFAETIETYQRALSIRRTTGNTWADARMLYVLGDCHRAPGATSDAVESLRDAKACYEQTSDTTGHVRALDLLGQVLHVGGDEPDALEAWRRALEAVRSSNPTVRLRLASRRASQKLRTANRQVPEAKGYDVDVSSFILPGAQSLVSSILADGWAQARGALARRWSQRGAINQQAAEQELDKGHELSEYIGAAGENRRELLETYWTGYLAGLGAAHADLLEAIRELGQAQRLAPPGSTVHNSNTGTVGTLLQAGDVHGNISFGR